MDGGDIEYLGMGEDRVVNVRLHGACCGCPSAIITLKHGVETRIRQECPEVVAVEAI
jgi:Fe-S cluster biogenesis protein NfuA